MGGGKIGRLLAANLQDDYDVKLLEKDSEKAEQIIEIMESAVELKVPNKVDYEQGDNWGDIK